LRVVVTGAAGFVGSHLVEALVARGDHVLGVDSLNASYDPRVKRRNLKDVAGAPGFELVTLDLREDKLESVFDGASVIFHEAAQPGVRASFGAGFLDYCGNNVVATQRVLEAAKAVGCPRFVFASSSSVYGNTTRYPTPEDALPAPFSPYGVTKLAAEHLCGVYAANWGLSTVALRYFTVYGPRQRPDMAVHKLIDAALRDEVFGLFGDGNQVRDFTYVDDVVRATVLASAADVRPGTVLNIAGGSSVTMLELAETVGALIGSDVRLDRTADQPGDVKRTGANTTRARAVLAWEPAVGLQQGLAAQLATVRSANKIGA
jgi:nucleoside-diphosphate-sugar epimerase